MPIRVSADLWQLLVYSFYGAAWALWGGSLLLLGLKVGENRGYRRAPEKVKEEFRQACFDRDVAQEKVRVMEEVRRHDKVTIGQLAAARPWQAQLTEEPARLRAVRG